jgi:hypothetical protein
VHVLHEYSIYFLLIYIFLHFSVKGCLHTFYYVTNICVAPIAFFLPIYFLAVLEFLNNLWGLGTD